MCRQCPASTCWVCFCKLLLWAWANRRTTSGWADALAHKQRPGGFSPPEKEAVRHSLKLVSKCLQKPTEHQKVSVLHQCVYWREVLSQVRPDNIVSSLPSHVVCTRVFILSAISARHRLTFSTGWTLNSQRAAKNTARGIQPPLPSVFQSRDSNYNANAHTL